MYYKYECMDGKDDKHRVQFKAADIAKQEQPRFFTKVEQSSIKIFHDKVRTHRKSIILVAVSGLALIGLVIVSLMLIDIKKRELAQAPPSDGSISLADEVASYLAGNYDGTYEELEQLLQDFIGQSREKGDISSVVLMTLALADLYNSMMYVQNSIDLLIEGIEWAPTDSVKVRFMDRLVDTYERFGMRAEQIEYLRQLVAFPDNAIHLDGESWRAVKMFRQAQLDRLIEEEERE